MPSALLTGTAFEPEPCDFAHGHARSLDAFAAVHAREQLGALRFGVGFRVAFGGLPHLTAGGVAIGELVLARDRFAGVAIDALVDALGDAHPSRMWSPPPRRRVAVLGEWVLQGS